MPKSSEPRAPFPIHLQALAINVVVTVSLLLLATAYHAATKKPAAVPTSSPSPPRPRSFFEDPDRTAAELKRMLARTDADVLVQLVVREDRALVEALRGDSALKSEFLRDGPEPPKVVEATAEQRIRSFPIHEAEPQMLVDVVGATRARMRSGDSMRTVVLAMRHTGDPAPSWMVTTRADDRYLFDRKGKLVSSRRRGGAPSPGAPGALVRDPERLKEALFNRFDPHHPIRSIVIGPDQAEVEAMASTSSQRRVGYHYCDLGLGDALARDGSIPKDCALPLHRYHLDFIPELLSDDGDVEQIQLGFAKCPPGGQAEIVVRYAGGELARYTMAEEQPAEGAERSQ